MVSSLENKKTMREDNSNKPVTEDFFTPLFKSWGITSPFLMIAMLCTLFLFSVFYSALSMGFVISKLWLWFVVPVFGVGTLSLAKAWGLWTFVAFPFGYYTAGKVYEYRGGLGVYIASMIVYPWLALVTIFIVKKLVFGM